MTTAEPPRPRPPRAKEFLPKIRKDQLKPDAPIIGADLTWLAYQWRGSTDLQFWSPFDPLPAPVNQFIAQGMLRTVFPYIQLRWLGPSGWIKSAPMHCLGDRWMTVPNGIWEPFRKHIL